MIDWIAANLPATTDELIDGMRVHVDWSIAALEQRLRDMRDAGHIMCTNGVWHLLERGRKFYSLGPRPVEVGSSRRKRRTSHTRCDGIEARQVQGSHEKHARGDQARGGKHPS